MSLELHLRTLRLGDLYGRKCWNKWSSAVANRNIGSSGVPVSTIELSSKSKDVTRLASWRIERRARKKNGLATINRSVYYIHKYTLIRYIRICGGMQYIGRLVYSSVHVYVSYLCVYTVSVCVRI